MQERKNYLNILAHVITANDKSNSIDIYNASGQNPGCVEPEEAVAILRGIRLYNRHKNFATIVKGVLTSGGNKKQ